MGIHPGVVDVHGDAVIGQFPNDVDHAGITQIRAILLEGQAEHQHPAVLRHQVAPGHEFDDTAGDEGAHAVVDAPTGEDDLRVIADGLGLVKSDSRDPH